MAITPSNVPSPKHITGHQLREIRKDRHSASPTSHCVASHTIKKGGGGGKYTWGSALDYEAPAVTDPRDPDYEEINESQSERQYSSDVSETLKPFTTASEAGGAR